VDEFEKYLKKVEKKSEMVDLKKVKKQLISRFQHELKRMLILNIHENEMQELGMLQMEIYTSKFV
jgi:membrane protease subunit (stomatin/prohibitin family)